MGHQAAVKDIVVPAQSSGRRLNPVPEMSGNPRVKEERSDPLGQPLLPHEAAAQPIEVKLEPRASGFRPASQLLASQASQPSPSAETKPTFGSVTATRQGRPVKMPQRFRDLSG